jgi:multidrug efflux pump subunit AcrA (membrane-fusion protein)
VWARPRKLGKGGALAVAGVLATGSGGGVWALAHDGATATPPTTRLVAASTSTVTQTVTATGTIAPAERADLSFEVTGTVTSVTASVGQVVTKGQALATVDATLLQSAVDAAQAQRDAAETDAEQTSAQATLDEAEEALAGATLRSTINGTVAALSLAVGDRVGSGGVAVGGAAGGATTSTSDVTVISTNRFLVNASVGSADLASVKKGLQARITPTGATTAVFGTVRSVGIVATSATSAAGATGSATFPVVIAVTGTPKGLYVGGSASVVITISQTEGVLSVPTQAISTVDGKTVVTLRKGADDVQTEVGLGRANGATTQITSGLAEGDQVVVTGGVVGPGSGTRSGQTQQTTRGQSGQAPVDGVFPGGQPPAGFPGAS